MTTSDKLNRLKTILQVTGSEEDSLLYEYLSMANDEILNWLYINSSVPEEAVMPEKYEQIQIQAVVTGFNLIGGEGEKTHVENGIHRYFTYTDMLQYIHANVRPYIGVAE